MAPVPAHTAAELRCHYQGPFGSHTMLFHFSAAADEATSIGKARTVITAMALTQWGAAVWNSAEWTPAGSSVSHPVTWTPIETPGAANPTTASAPGLFVQFGGRAPSGVRAKWYLFETAYNTNNSMRIQRAADANLAAIMDALTNSWGAAEGVSTADGGQPSIYQYANIGINDYITHRVR